MFPHQVLGSHLVYAESDCDVFRRIYAVPQGRASLKTLLKTSSAMGNGEMQFICVENDTLRKAQKKPEEYQDLIVRVAGYCVYFVELCEEVQNEIISRTMLGE